MTDEPEPEADEDEDDVEESEDEPDDQPVTRRVVIRGARLVEVTTHPAGMEIR